MNPDDGLDWAKNPRKKPELRSDDEELASEHGRVIGMVDYTSHWLVLVRVSHLFFLLVKHGAGEERIMLGSKGCFPVESILAMPSDDRYLLLHNFHDLHGTSRRCGYGEAEQRWRQAIADGRAKRRKVRNQNLYRVWIES